MTPYNNKVGDLSQTTNSITSFHHHWPPKFYTPYWDLITTVEL